MRSITLIEDDVSYATLLAGHLEREGYRVTVEHSGASGLARLQSDEPDLVILDLMLPHLGGYTVLQRLRDGGSNVPVLVMTARGTEEDKLRGFGLGADDYVVKPVGLREVLARVRALMRRYQTKGEPVRTDIAVGDLSIDLAARIVRVGGTDVSLRPKEFDLLAALARHRGRVVARRELMLEVWGYVSDTHSRTLETHMASLRLRLGDDSTNSRFVVTVRRVGYRLGDG